eukprot:6247314-Amphidinium_carterae.1
MSRQRGNLALIAKTHNRPEPLGQRGSWIPLRTVISFGQCHTHSLWHHRNGCETLGLDWDSMRSWDGDGD